MKELNEKCPLLLSIIVLVLSLGAIHYSPDGLTTIQGSIMRFGLALVAFLVLKFVYDINCLKPEKHGISTTVKMAWVTLIFPPLISIIISVNNALTITGINPNFVKEVIEALILCLSVGFFEEILFRGILGIGLIRTFKNNKHAFLLAVLISSFLFGYVHIMYDINFSDGFVLTQCLVKTLQTGTYGIIYFLIFCKTKSLIYVSVYHALYDFIGMAGAALADPAYAKEVNTGVGGYVTQNAELGAAAIGVMLVTFVFILIVVIVVNKIFIKKQDIESFNAFILGQKQ